MQPREAVERIAAHVARLRRAKGLTQDELAVALGWAAQQVRRVEQARAVVTVAALCELSAFFRVAPAKLLAPAKMQKTGPGRPKGT